MSPCQHLGVSLKYLDGRQECQRLSVRPSLAARVGQKGEEQQLREGFPPVRLGPQISLPRKQLARILRGRS